MYRKLTYSFYFVSVIPGTDIKCSSPRLVSGCDIVGGSCRCDRVPSCPDDRPFTFQSQRECQMNLAVMVQHTHSIDNGKTFQCACITAHLLYVSYTFKILDNVLTGNKIQFLKFLKYHSQLNVLITNENSFSTVISIAIQFLVKPCLNIILKQN